MTLFAPFCNSRGIQHYWLSSPLGYQPDFWDVNGYPSHCWPYCLPFGAWRQSCWPGQDPGQERRSWRYPWVPPLVSTMIFYCSPGPQSSCRITCGWHNGVTSDCAWGSQIPIQSTTERSVQSLLGEVQNATWPVGLAQPMLALFLEPQIQENQRLIANRWGPIHLISSSCICSTCTQMWNMVKLTSRTKPLLLHIQKKKDDLVMSKLSPKTNTSRSNADIMRPNALARPTFEYNPKQATWHDFHSVWNRQNFSENRYNHVSDSTSPYPSLYPISGLSRLPNPMWGASRPGRKRRKSLQRYDLQGRKAWWHRHSSTTKRDGSYELLLSGCKGGPKFVKVNSWSAPHLSPWWEYGGLLICSTLGAIRLRTMP